MTDFFNQFTNFVQWLGDIMGRGITAPKDIYNKFNDIKDYVTVYLGDFVHPYFLPIIFVMISIALLHKIMHWGSKE